MSTPTVMVSSTFYDLRQVRTDVGRFIGAELGYTPLLSEFPSFPVDPDVDTVENCRKRVERNADILVLIIGGRYGSIDRNTDKSITNLEYLEAREKRIPIYAFVDKQILAVLPVWQKNPEGNYSNVVDTPRLFEFVEQVRINDATWTFPFETAQDIVAALRVQLAYLFLDSLRVRNRLAGVSLPAFYETLTATAFRLALEKPKAWEYRLFFQTWVDEVELRGNLIREYEAGLRIGASDDVDAALAANWFQTRIKELEGLITSANHLMNVSAQEAFGARGEPGDPEAIVWTSHKLGEVFESLIDWTQRIRRARVQEPFDKVAVELSRFTDSAIERMRYFPRESLSAVNDALRNVLSGVRQTIEMTLVFRLSNVEPYLRKHARRQKVSICLGLIRRLEGIV
ncbi:MAG: DUF4062 domain-containing protein [Desulfomonilaceae bacterium]